MTSDRIKQIQQETAYPESHSVKNALLQVWNECAQKNNEMYTKDQVIQKILDFRFQSNSDITREEVEIWFNKK